MNIIQESDQFKMAQRQLEGRCQHCGKPKPNHHFRCVTNLDHHGKLIEMLDTAMAYEDSEDNFSVTLRDVIDNQRDV